MELYKKEFILSDSIGHIVNIVANKMKLELENSFKEHGYNITALQWFMLGVIYENEGITQNELAEKSKKDKTNIARIIEKLEKQKLIKRVRDDIDKRVFRLSPTQLGKETREELAYLAIELINKSTVGISDEESKMCLKILKKIYSNLE